MTGLGRLLEKQRKRVIGLMSGTSADGMDAALVEIEGSGISTSVTQLAFLSLPYTDRIRGEILRLTSGNTGGSRDLCLFHFLLGELALEACRAVCEKAGIAPETVDLVGSHGQTLYHQPEAVPYMDRMVRGTLQLGEASVIAEGLGCVVVSDFRVRDFAAGGQGAPLVPYTEYLLYRREKETVGLQNIGGIGNLTVLPANGQPEDTLAFDTGPGNMIMDQVAEWITEGRQRCDENGRMAMQGLCSGPLLDWMLSDPWLSQAPPRSTGREKYGKAYVDEFMRRGRALGLSGADLLATAARFTAESIRLSLTRFCPVRPDCLIVGGGGSRNPFLMSEIRKTVGIPVMLNEDLGYDSDAKEAIAFAVLANECIHEHTGCMVSVTGASHPTVLGKITL